MRVQTFPAVNIYIQNLITGLNLLEDAIKPNIILIHNAGANIDDIININYPYLTPYPYIDYYRELPIKIINKIFRYFFKRPYKEYFDINFPKEIDVMFPYVDFKETEYVKEKIYWKPDFQEFHYPIYFSPAEIDYNINFLDRIKQIPDVKLVFSSKDSYNDFNYFYPDHVCQTEVLSFVSFLPDLTKVNFTDTKNKYNINKPYFFIANQFWPHKNHITVFKAVKHLKSIGINPLVVCSGKTDSIRDVGVFKRLQYYLKFHNLTDNFIFTGFIDRTEQLLLMKNSIAVIQPSLFEGWSTVIEDAKALNLFIIASNINVNKEQESRNILFFEPYNYNELADYILEISEKQIETQKINYKQNIEQYEKNLVRVLNL